VARAFFRFREEVRGVVDHISPTRLDRLRRLIDAGQEARFYWWPEWQELRAAVLKMDNFECQICKARGRYSRGTIVHHVKHLRERPDLALSIFDPDTGERQLITVCKACHEEEHPESLRRREPSAAPLTVERWD
jgi:5-methylcytosine-specific restriction endonuclease McrA